MGTITIPMWLFIVMCICAGIVVLELGYLVKLIFFTNGNALFW